MQRFDWHAFNRGEIDPLASGVRTDLDSYQRAAQECRNMELLAIGGARVRPGFRYVTSLASDAMLVSFVFDADETYLLAFLEGQFQVFRDDVFKAVVLWPMTLAQAREASFTQYGDSLIAFHRDVAPQLIQRVTDTSWTVAAFPWRAQSSGRRSSPHHKYAARDVSIYATGLTGGVNVLSGNGYPFHVSHAGTTRFRILNKELVCIAVPGTSGAAQDPSNPGWYRGATMTVYETLANTTAQTDWTEEQYSPVRGYPACGAFYRNRLALGGGARPTAQAFSGARDVFEFELGSAQDDDAVSFTLLSETLDTISWMIAWKRRFLAGTAAAIWTMEPDVLTPSTPGPISDISIGAAAIAPLRVDDGIMFIGRVDSGLPALYEIRPPSAAAAIEGISAQNVSLLAGHLINAPVQMAYRRGDGVRFMGQVFVVNGDGTLAVMNTLRDERISGWSLWSMKDAAIKSVAVVHGKLYALVLRQGRYSIEVLDPSVQMDGCAVGAAAGAPQTTWAGLSHLDGLAVTVLIDGWLLEEHTVDGGSVVLDTPASTVQIGTRRSWSLETLPPPLSLLEPRKPRLERKAVIVSADLYQARGVYARDAGLLTMQRGQGESFDSLAEVTRVVHFSPADNTTGTARFYGDEPYRATIRSVSVWID
jgi:hypothetical protein